MKEPSDFRDEPAIASATLTSPFEPYCGRVLMAPSYIEYSSWQHLSKVPLVSIVMPTYNHVRYLREAIDGVLAQQTDFSFELIVGEDASTDGSRAIALEYWRSHPHLVRVLAAERNVGMHENAARLLCAARGRFLAFCEGDDCWHRPDKLRVQVSLLQRDINVALVCSSWRTISEGGSVLVADELGLKKDRNYELYVDEILDGKVKTVTVCTRTHLMQQALKRSPLCKPGLYPFADAPLWVEASRHGRCVCLPEAFGTYRLSRNSATRPADLMDVYRFIAAASDFDRAVLALYGLRKGARATQVASIQATRKRLRALALLGDAPHVQEELTQLSQLGAHLRMRERLWYLGALLSQPGTRGAEARSWVLQTWQRLSRRYRQPGGAVQTGTLPALLRFNAKSSSPTSAKRQIETSG